MTQAIPTIDAEMCVCMYVCICVCSNATAMHSQPWLKTSFFAKAKWTPWTPLETTRHRLFHAMLQGAARDRLLYHHAQATTCRLILPHIRIAQPSLTLAVQDGGCRTMLMLNVRIEAIFSSCAICSRKIRKEATRNSGTKHWHAGRMPT